jgi:hypothetical protein
VHIITLPSYRGDSGHSLSTSANIMASSQTNFIEIPVDVLLEITRELDLSDSLNIIAVSGVAGSFSARKVTERTDVYRM